MTNVLIEGGGEVLGSLLDLDQIDEVHVFIAPKLFGGAAAPGPLAGLGRAADKRSRGVGRGAHGNDRRGRLSARPRAAREPPPTVNARGRENENGPAISRTQQAGRLPVGRSIRRSRRSIADLRPVGPSG